MYRNFHFHLDSDLVIFFHYISFALSFNLSSIFYFFFLGPGAIDMGWLTASLQNFTVMLTLKFSTF